MFIEMKLSESMQYHGTWYEQHTIGHTPPLYVLILIGNTDMPTVTTTMSQGLTDVHSLTQFLFTSLSLTFGHKPYTTMSAWL